mgnify:CR=1 FL=1
MGKTFFSLVAAAISMALCGSSRAAVDLQPVHEGTRILHSGKLVVEVGDPDSPDCLWNEGLRFSPVANVIRVALDGREFCYAPVGGGALTYLGGLPMEFDIGQESYQPDPPGYSEGVNNSQFLKVGVGILTRNASDYNFSTNYPVVELADTTVTWEADRAHFVQTLSGMANGYSCRLEEDVIVKSDTLLMVYALTNTGVKTFTTEQYLHNFLTFSETPVGPHYRVYFPYEMTESPEAPVWEPPYLKEVGRGSYVWVDNNPDVVSLQNMILYLKTISSFPKTWVTKPEGYLGRDSVAVEQSSVGQRVVIDSSLWSAYIGIWTTDYQVSPEQFIIMTLEPGETVQWTRSYRFSADGVLPQDCTGDNVVDTNDLAALSSAWLADPSAANWDSACDVSAGDDWIDNSDFAAIGGAWHQDAANPAPVAHWKLDETSGLVAADSEGSHHGSLMGYSGDDSQWVNNHPHTGLWFDGTGQYVQVDGFAGIVGKKPRTVSAWVKTGGAHPIMAWGGSEPGASWLIEVDEDQRLRLSCGSGYISANEKQIGGGQWRHIAVVLDPADPRRPLVSDVALYIDGKRRTIYKMAEAEIDTGSTDDVWLGAEHGPGGAFFAGGMDEVAIFDVAVGRTAIYQRYLLESSGGYGSGAKR